MKTSIHSLLVIAACVAYTWIGPVLSPAFGEPLWTNYGNGWFGAAVRGQGDSIWVSGAGGVSKYDRRTFREVARWGCQDGLIGLNQFSVCDFDPFTDDLWVTRFGGVSRWDGSTWRHGTGGWCSYAIAVTKDHVWTGANNLQKFDKSGRLLKTYSAAKGEVPADNIWFLRVDRDDPNFLWMAHYIGPVVNGKVMGYDREAEKWWRATDRPPIDPKHLGGLSKWDTRTDKCVAVYHPNNSKVPTNRGGVLGEDSSGHIWFTGDEPSTGIGRLDKRTGTWEILDRDSGCTLPSLMAWSLVVDPADNVFMSTANTSIHAYWAKTRRWEVLKIPPRKTLHPGLAKYEVAIMQNWNQWGPGDGSFYCATGWGLVFYNRKDNAWRWFDDLEQVGNLRFGPILDVASLAEDDEGRIWLAGRTLGCLGRDGRIEIYPVGKCLNDPNDHLRDLQAAHGTVWATDDRQGGLIALDIAGKTHRYYQGKEALRFGLASDRIKAIGKDRDNRLWFGFEEAGVLQSFDGKAWTTLRSEDTGGQLTGAVTSIKQDAQGRLWLTTTDGLVRFDGRTWKRYSIQAGAPKLGFAAMDFDHEGNVWLLGKTVPWSTELYRFDGRRFDRPGPKQSVSTVLVDRQGRVWTSDPTHAFLVREGGQWRSIPPSKNGPGGTRYRCGYQGRDGKLYFGGDAYYSGGICLTVLAP